MVLMLTAFRLAWPAFAYSIEDDGEARRTYAYVLTYVTLVTTWVATALALLSPWIVQWIAAPAFEESSRVVGPLAFSAVAFAGYIVVAIGVGRAEADAVQLGRDRGGRRREHRSQPDPDPAVRDDGGCHRDDRRLCE